MAGWQWLAEMRLGLNRTSSGWETLETPPLKLFPAPIAARHKGNQEMFCCGKAPLFPLKLVGSVSLFVSQTVSKGSGCSS